MTPRYQNTTTPEMIVRLERAIERTDGAETNLRIALREANENGQRLAEILMLEALGELRKLQSRLREIEAALQP
jgi:hypothetical protein